MQVPMLDLRAQYASIKEEVLPAMAAVCDSQQLCLGPAVERFEREVAQYCGCAHAVGVSSGSDALLAALMAIGVGPGDEVITTPFTFFATAGAVARLCARPVFADVDPQTCNIDPDQIPAKVTRKTKAVIPVHLFGQVAPMKPILSLAQEHGLCVIEDAAQSIGAMQDGVRCGGIGQIGCFSFYPTKNLGGFGDGGLITTQDEALATKLRFIRDHGQNPRYHYHLIGGNFRLDGLQGAVLSVKLRHLDQWNQRRQAHAALYDRLLAGAPVKTPRVERGNVSVYHQYTIMAPQRDALQRHLADHGIGSAVFYPRPLHLQPCFAYLGHKPGDFPVTERACQEVLSLPIYPELTDAQIEYVAATVRSFYP
ncbi:MAG: DegT/DnrJ/EryC1/StrS family aminotransferase [Phycisphaerae bacterium]|nr:DegT/DnrJ/EryC1/StrS family aminotransferase [Phycisphaerae bacterium]